MGTAGVEAMWEQKQMRSPPDQEGAWITPHPDTLQRGEGEGPAGLT